MRVEEPKLLGERRKGEEVMRDLICTRCGQVLVTVNARLTSTMTYCRVCKRWVHAIREGGGR